MRKISQSTNNMPEVCGRICPQDGLCEGNCVIEQSGHGTVTIGSIEKYITDMAWEKGGKTNKGKRELKQSVELLSRSSRNGMCRRTKKVIIKLFIYDRYDRPYGLLIYGIPNQTRKVCCRRRTKLLKKVA